MPDDVLRPDTCPSCGGLGWTPEAYPTRSIPEEVTCPDCAGSGKAENCITVNEGPRRGLPSGLVPTAVEDPDPKESDVLRLTPGAVSAALGRQVVERDPWKDVVIDALVVAGIYGERHEDDPRLAVRELVEWEVDVALDPRVSSRAQALSSGKAELIEALTDMLAGWKYIRRVHGDLYGVGWDRAQEKAEAVLARHKGETSEP